MAADRVQVCVQALILREQGYTCDEAVVYYNQTKQRVRVPPPLVDSPKCPRCSLVGICLPDETLALLHGLRQDESDVAQQLLLFDDAEAAAPTVRLDAADVRRLVPARDDLRPLYVTGYGFSIGKSGGVLQIKDRARWSRKPASTTSPTSAARSWIPSLFRRRPH